jgi:hypothetical protein
MDEQESQQQQQLHEAIEQVLVEHGDLDGLLLTGWVVVFETAALNDEHRAHCGHFYGPRELTTWRALGLLEWARRFSIGPGDEDDDP